jgi:hypothetical protein
MNSNNKGPRTKRLINIIVVALIIILLSSVVSYYTAKYYTARYNVSNAINDTIPETPKH